MAEVTDVKTVAVNPDEAPITNPAWANATAVLRVGWRPFGGLLCMIAIAVATIIDPTEPKMWVAAAVAGVGIIGRSSEKIASKA